MDVIFGFALLFLLFLFYLYFFLFCCSAPETLAALLWDTKFNAGFGEQTSDGHAHVLSRFPYERLEFLSPKRICVSVFMFLDNLMRFKVP